MTVSAEGGCRVLLAYYRAEHRVVFLYGFAKSERENIDGDELLTLREIGAAWFSADDRRLARVVEEGVLREVIDDRENAT